MRQTTTASPIAMAREHAAGDRQAADDKRRVAPDDEPRPTDGVEATRIRRLARTLVGPLRGGVPGATRTA